VGLQDDERFRLVKLCCETMRVNGYEKNKEINTHEKNKICLKETKQKIRTGGECTEELTTKTWKTKF
jgi:hypothetical protein